MGQVWRTWYRKCLINIISNHVYFSYCIRDAIIFTLTIIMYCLFLLFKYNITNETVCREYDDDTLLHPNVDMTVYLVD